MQQPAPDETAQTHLGLGDLDPSIDAWTPAQPKPAVPWRGISETLEVVALAVIMFAGVRAVAQNWVVVGASMEPTFQSGNLLVVKKLAYRSFDLSWVPGVSSDAWRPFGEPVAGDIIVFHYPQRPETDFIKRIAALPGQTVEISEGRLLVDGRALDERYLLAPPRPEDYPPTLVPDGHVFVLGDNRDYSSDSRSWGMLDVSLIVGKPAVRYWPPLRAGLVQHHRHEAPEPAGVAIGVPSSP